jgi:hypothetical protein
MEMAVNLKVDRGTKKRIILLSDGYHNGNRRYTEIIDILQESPKANDITTDTLGVGSNVDEVLLKEIASTGKGSFSLISDREGGSGLNKKVIATLQKALEPALEGCRISKGVQ